MNSKYVIITPVRDEEKYLESTIQAIIQQTVLPAEWVIVNDGSKDATGDIAERYAARHSWLHVVHRADRGFRKPGGGVMEAFYEGYRSLTCKDWGFLAKLDGDLSFSPTYFEECLRYFGKEPRLGVGGGEIYHRLNGHLKLEETPRFHVRGATKIYRRECWESIGGLWPAPGWDTIDEVKANMLGWQSHAFADLPVTHYRVTGTENGLIRDRIKHGVACYISAYHPLFTAASCLRRLVKKPRIIGSAAMMYGFLKSYFTQPPRMTDPSYISYIRRQQLNRLCGMETIWK